MRVTSKGQVTIPRHIRQRRGMGAGTEVDFLEKNGEVVVMKSRNGRKASKGVMTISPAISIACAESWTWA